MGNFVLYNSFGFDLEIETPVWIYAMVVLDFIFIGYRVLAITIDSERDSRSPTIKTLHDNRPDM